VRFLPNSRQNNVRGNRKEEALRFFLGMKRREKIENLKKLIEIVSPNQISTFVKENDYGVATLLSSEKILSELPTAANFILFPEGIHDDDLIAIPFAIPSAFQAARKAAELILNVPDPSRQSLLLHRAMSRIFPGAMPQGRAFIITISIIEQVMLRENLVKVSA